MQASLMTRSSPTRPGTLTSHGNLRMSINYSMYNCHVPHRYSLGSRVYRPKSMIPSQKEKWEPLRRPTVSETPHAPPMQWPAWLENLLSVVHYNLRKGLSFFCVSCNRGLYQEKHFEEGANHHGHDRLRMYEYESCICVNWADIESLGVNAAQIQEFTWSVPGAASALFLFMHNTFGYAIKGPSQAPWENCANCGNSLRYVRVWTKTKFCCLDCKVEFMNGVGLSYYDRLSPKLVSPQRTLSPGYEPRLADWTYAPETMRAQGKISSYDTNDDDDEECLNDLEAAFYEYLASLSPRDKSQPVPWMFQQSGESNGSKSLRKTDVDAYNEASTDVSSHDTNNGDELDQFRNDVEAAKFSNNQKLLDLLSPLHDSSKPAPWMFEQYGPETDSEDEIGSCRCSHSDCKVERVAEVGIVVPGTPPADVIDTTLVSTDRESTLTERGPSSKNERITQVQGHSEGLGYEGHFGEYEDPEQRCCGGSSWDIPGAIVDKHFLSADPTSIEAQSPNAEEVDPISFPELLYEDQLHVLLSPCEEILSLMRKTTPSGSPTRFSEDQLSVKLNSYVELDSNPLDSMESPGPAQSECSFATPSSFGPTALAAASCSRHCSWPRHIPAVTKSDRDVGGGVESVEGQGLLPKTLDNNILRKAASLLLSLDSEFENNYRISDEEDTNSIQASSSAGKPEFSVASPEVLSYKVQGSIDFKSLKQLAATFDPQRWISEARCPEVAAPSLAAAHSPVQ